MVFNIRKSSIKDRDRVKKNEPTTNKNQNIYLGFGCAYRKLVPVCLGLRVQDMRPDIYQVEPLGIGSLSVMAKPISGEWIDDEFAAIAESGIDRIVSLLERSESYEVGLENEKDYTEKYGMEFISFPIKDRGMPQSMNEFSSFTKNLYHDAVAGINTVIHCRAGIGRTGLVAAGVLLHCAFEPEAAFEHISKKRGVSVPDTSEQREWLCHYYESVFSMQ